jgi:hypothetical protein
MAPEAALDTMMTDEEILIIVIRTMKALRDQEEERDRK